jgi:hypothetical protein
MAESRQQAALREPEDVSVRRVLGGAAAIALGIALALLASYLLWQWWNAPSGVQPPGGPDAGAVPAIAPPVLQSAPQQERAQYFAEKQRLLESWGWVDRDAGIARIPLEEAMRIMAARGGGRNASATQEQR